MEVLSENKLYVIRNALSQETCEQLKIEYMMIKDVVEYSSQGPTSDPIMPVPLQCIRQYVLKQWVKQSNRW